MKIGKEFKPLILKEYEFWALSLSPKQLPYVGRTYAWWKDRHIGEGEKMAPWELPLSALLELHSLVMLDVVRGLDAIGYPTQPYGERFLLNTAYLANESGHNHHMHYHFIPRVRDLLNLEKLRLTVTDERWGKNYLQPQNAPTLTHKRLLALKAVMVEAIA